MMTMMIEKKMKPRTVMMRWMKRRSSMRQKMHSM